MIDKSKETNSSETKTRRKFDDTFKRDAVTLWLSSGKAAHQVAEELGISESCLHAWKKAQAAVRPVAASQVQSELEALRRENAYLRQQRDILKKTLGILSEAPHSATKGLKP